MYIPYEIFQFIVDAINNDVSNIQLCAWNKFKSEYSVFKCADYRTILHSIKSRQFETCQSYISSGLFELSHLESYWMERLRKFVIPIEDNVDDFSNKIFLLTILENIIKNPLTSNKIYLSLNDDYRTVWWKYKTPLIKTVPNFYKVVITFKNSGFYHVRTVDDSSTGDLNIRKKIWDKGSIVNYFEYGYFDDSLYDLFFLDSFREKLINLIKDTI